MLATEAVTARPVVQITGCGCVIEERAFIRRCRAAREIVAAGAEAKDRFDSGERPWSEVVRWLEILSMHQYRARRSLEGSA